MLSIALPKGSLEQGTLDLFARAGMKVRRPSARSLRADIVHPGIVGVHFHKPQEIPGFVEGGIYDLGITGGDWIREKNAKVDVLGSFGYSRSTDRPWRLVLAVHDDAPVGCPGDLAPGSRIATEYPELTKGYFERVGVDVEIVPSRGATESAVPNIADAIVDVMDTGTSLRDNGLRMIDTIGTYRVEVVASLEAVRDERRLRVVEEVLFLLRSAAEAEGLVMLTIRVDADRAADVLGRLPDSAWASEVSTTAGAMSCVVQAVVAESDATRLLVEVSEAGATLVSESPILRVAQGFQTP